MEKEPVLKRAQKILADFPRDEMHPASKKLFYESPFDWVASRNRLLRMALLNGDSKVLSEVVDDVAHVVGNRGAEFWKLTVMGDLVEQELNNT